MFKITLSLVSIFMLLNASEYTRANSASAEALKNLDCEFDDCPKPAPKPKIVVKEKVIVKEVPVIVEKVVEKEKIIYKDRPVVRENTTIASSKLEPLVIDLPKENFSASTFWSNQDDHAPYRAKMNEHSSYSNWSAATNDTRQWLQIDLGKQRTINGIGTAGRFKNYDQYVKSYRLSYSNDTFEWNVYKENGVEKIFDGNQDHHTEVKYKLHNPVKARYIRFNPLSWHKHITMRVELYGE